MIFVRAFVPSELSQAVDGHFVFLEGEARQIRAYFSGAKRDSAGSRASVLQAVSQTGEAAAIRWT